MEQVKPVMLAIIGAALMALIPGEVLADKVGAAMTGVQSIGSIGHNSDDGVSAHASCDADSAVCDEPNDTGWKTILEVNMQTQNHAELAIDMALQCGLVTDTTVRSKGGSKDGATAEGKVSVRVKAIYANGTMDYALPGNEDDGVTYCSRAQTLAASFAGLDCTAALETGEITCANEEELQLILSTLSANAFNFVLTGVPVGTHLIQVQARAQAGADIFGTALGSASGEAFIGLGSVFVDEVQLINGYGFIE